MKMLFPLAITVALFTGCMPDAKSGAGFTLPDGDPDKGRQTFVQLQCNACHTVDGVELEPHESQVDQMIALGGERAKVQTYGHLVTSIINPSHRFAVGYSDADIKQDGESKMRKYNDEMTVTQLMDLVAFLQAHYRLREYHPTPYMP